MKRTLIDIKYIDLPDAFKTLINGVDIYDSSCSPEAKVFFIDKSTGYYLKVSDKGSLKNEADMARFFHKKGLSSSVVEYVSMDKDFLLTEKVRGEDCTFSCYLDDPKRLSVILGESLRMLHSMDYNGCPIENRIDSYYMKAEENYNEKRFDPSYFSFENKIDIEEAHKMFHDGKKLLKNDTLIHGDYCLPNIMLDNWKLSGFIDLGCGGVGDKHIDLFWGAWTLNYNLNTDKYRDRFFDAYGREDVDFDLIRLVGAIECFG